MASTRTTREFTYLENGDPRCKEISEGKVGLLCNRCKISFIATNNKCSIDTAICRHRGKCKTKLMAAPQQDGPINSVPDASNTVFSGERKAISLSNNAREDHRVMEMNEKVTEEIVTENSDGSKVTKKTVREVSTRDKGKSNEVSSTVTVEQLTQKIVDMEYEHRLNDTQRVKKLFIQMQSIEEQRAANKLKDKVLETVAQMNMAVMVEGVHFKKGKDDTDFSKMIHDPAHTKTTLFIINENFAAWRCPDNFKNGAGTACIRSFTYKADKTSNDGPFVMGIPTGWTSASGGYKQLDTFEMTVL